MVGHHHGPLRAALAVRIAVEVYHRHQDVDVLSHLRGILAVIILTVGLGHKGGGKDQVRLEGLEGLVQLAAEFGHAAGGGYLFRRVVLPCGAAEADVVQMDAVHTVTDVTLCPVNDLVEVILLVAVQRVIHGVYPLAFLVEALEPYMHLEAFALGLAYERQRGIYAVLFKGSLVQEDVLDILGHHLVEVYLVHELGPKPDSVEIRPCGLLATKQAEGHT